MQSVHLFNNNYKFQTEGLHRHTRYNNIDIHIQILVPYKISLAVVSYEKDVHNQIKYHKIMQLQFISSEDIFHSVAIIMSLTLNFLNTE